MKLKKGTAPAFELLLTAVFIVPALASCGATGSSRPAATTSPAVTPSTAVTLTPSAALAPAVTLIPTVSPEPTATPESGFSVFSGSGEPKDVTYEIDASVNDSMPMYRFIASGVTDADLYHLNSADWYGRYGLVTGLDILDADGTAILSADFTDNSAGGNGIYLELMSTMGLHVADVNFDGNLDVIVLDGFSGAHSNTWYDCWLWDPATSSFAACPSFSQICNPSIDSDNQCIYSSGGSGASNQLWEIYQFIEGQFVVTNSLEYNIGYNKGDIEYQFHEEKLENGEMVTVRDKTVQTDDYYTAIASAGYADDNLWQLNNPRWYMYGMRSADQYLGGVAGS